MKPNTSVFIPVRLKSKRLKNKALKKIEKKNSIIWCAESALRIKNIKNVVVMTSKLKQDNPLKLINFKKNIKFFRGDANNLILRFLDAARKFKVNTIIRVTGDCPFISHEIMDFLLKSHKKNDADFTAAKNYSVGTSGEIIEVSALKKLNKNIKNFKFSEYMTFFFLDNPKFFKLNLVNLPKKYIRDYRLTLDYKEDLKMFNKLVLRLKEKKFKINLLNIFKVLDKYKSLNKINSKKKLVYISKKFRKDILKFTKIRHGLQTKK